MAKLQYGSEKSKKKHLATTTRYKWLFRATLAYSTAVSGYVAHDKGLDQSALDKAKPVFEQILKSIR